MATSTIEQLEAKLDKLIELCSRLQSENHNLRDRETALLRERSKLLEKNEMARSKVEAMISRLKNLEIES
jgi:cell division protein ZapB